MNTKAVGELSEGIVLAELLKLGFSASLPFGNNQRYDLLVDDGSNIWKVQVKTGRLRSGGVYFNTASLNAFTSVRTTYAGQIDVFCVYCPDTQSVYVVPVGEVGASNMKLRIDPVGKQGNVSKVRWAKDYTLDSEKCVLKRSSAAGSAPGS
jgi:hypothetical protein